MQFPIIATHLYFEFPNGDVLFENISFSLSHQITALVGPNGIGKTSLARLITGELEATRGRIHRESSVKLFAQRVRAPDISVAEFLAADYSWSSWGERFLTGIDQETLCSQLSGGEWMRVRLAQVLDESYLILDEPTNDLDVEGRKALFDFLRQRKNGVLLISHDRECLSLCDEVLELSNHGVTKFGGGWSEYEKSRDHERNVLSENLETAKKNRDQAHQARQQKIDQQEKRNRKGAQAAARGGMPKILLGGRKRRAQVTTGKVDTETFQKAQEAISEAHEALAQLKAEPLMYANLMGEKLPNQKLILEAQNFNIRFQNWLYPQDLNFVWRGNLRLTIQGGNGSGKSTLIKALLGQRFESRGELKAGLVKTLYVDQKCESLDETKSIFENIHENSGMSESEIRSSLAQFLFTKESVFKKVSNLSGGERLRATLAKGFLSQQKPELLILDEPTNNLDLINIQFLENLVQQFPGALIVISHDKVFLENCRTEQEFILGR